MDAWCGEAVDGLPHQSVPWKLSIADVHEPELLGNSSLPIGLEKIRSVHVELLLDFTVVLGSYIEYALTSFG